MNKQRGYTIIELLIYVIAVVAVVTVCALGYALIRWVLTL